ncbi:MAG: hypothetical protein ABI700_06720 [Chloroflexota bacterium]
MIYGQRRTGAAINNVRGWWSEEVVGDTDRLGAEWDYHYQDMHRCKLRITEFVPNQKVVWLVLDNYFNFTKDKTEWIGTQMTFEIAKSSEQGAQTEVRFSHLGLVPEYECFEVCSNAWGFYIRGSLRSLITTGKGEPNHSTSTNAVDQAPLDRAQQNYSAIFVVDQSPAAAFAAINNVRGWWTENVEGSTHKLNDEFEVRFGDVHYSKQKLVEVVPDAKVVWLVEDSALNFIHDQSEWTGTHVMFEIAQKGDQTEVRFTHLGLVPVIECYDACSNAWGGYITGSLRSLITTGQGQPAEKEKAAP